MPATTARDRPGGALGGTRQDQAKHLHRSRNRCHASYAEMPTTRRTEESRQRSRPPGIRPQDGQLTTEPKGILLPGASSAVTVEQAPGVRKREPTHVLRDSRKDRPAAVSTTLLHLISPGRARANGVSAAPTRPSHLACSVVAYPRCCFWSAPRLSGSLRLSSRSATLRQ